MMGKRKELDWVRQVDGHPPRPAFVHGCGLTTDGTDHTDKSDGQKDHFICEIRAIRGDFPLIPFSSRFRHRMRLAEGWRSGGVIFLSPKPDPAQHEPPAAARRGVYMNKITLTMTAKIRLNQTN